MVGLTSLNNLWVAAVTALGQCAHTLKGVGWAMFRTSR